MKSFFREVAHESCVECDMGAAWGIIFEDYIEDRHYCDGHISAGVHNALTTGQPFLVAILTAEEA